MSTSAEIWTYTLSRNGDTRIPALLKPNSFEDIAQSVVVTMRVLCCHRDMIAETEFCRPVYTVEIDRNLFDLFFNSPAGYRAAYFYSPGNGVDANALLMRSAASRLIEHSAQSKSELPPDFVQESLATPSSKAWLTECGKELDSRCAEVSGVPRQQDIERSQTADGKPPRI